VIKRTEADHPDYGQLQRALDKMGELADYIDLQIKETQTKKTLQYLKKKVVGLSVSQNLIDCSHFNSNADPMDIHCMCLYNLKDDF
jgi:hypothetical protein